VDSYRAAGGPVTRLRWPGAMAAATLGLALLTIPAAGLAAPSLTTASASPPASRLPATGSPGQLARLEARIARLAKQYRGELALLSQAEADAQVASATVLRLRREYGNASRGLARLAAASYMEGVQDPALVILGSGNDATGMLRAMATLQFVTQERIARERALKQIFGVEQRAERAASASTARLQKLVAALVGQRHRVAMLLAKFRPQSPVIGDHITPRMRQVKDAIDARFGPFVSIGCWRPGTTGEHPLGRACDFMLSTGGVMPTPANIQRGYRIAAWAQAHAANLGIMYIIYRQRIWDIRMASAGWVKMPDRGSITANHYDHVHISVF
jgi:hypothetical protein